MCPGKGCAQHSWMLAGIGRALTLNACIDISPTKIHGLGSRRLMEMTSEFQPRTAPTCQTQLVTKTGMPIAGNQMKQVATPDRLTRGLIQIHQDCIGSVTGAGPEEQTTGE